MGWIEMMFAKSEGIKESKEGRELREEEREGRKCGISLELYL